MYVNISTFARGFDGRQMYQWELIDERQRLLANGCALSQASAKSQARSAAERQGPGILLDMLEMREA